VADSGPILYRENYASDGTVRRGPNGKALTGQVQSLNVRIAEAPDLTPDLEKLVIVPMPLRTRDYLMSKAGSRLQVDYSTLDRACDIGLIDTESILQNGPVAERIFVERFQEICDNRLGFHVLLATARESIQGGRSQDDKRGFGRFSPADSNLLLARYLKNCL